VYIVSYYIMAIFLVVLIIFLFKKNSKNLILVGFVLGFVYFNILPFFTFILNDGITITEASSSYRWGSFSNILEKPDQIYKYFIAIYMMIFSIYLYTFTVKKPSQKKFTKCIKINYTEIIIFFSIFILLNILRESMIPEHITHWGLRAQYFNKNYGLIGNILSFILLGVKYTIFIYLLNYYNKENQRKFLLLIILLSVLDIYYSSNRIFFLISMISILYILIIEKRYKIILLSSLPALFMIFFMSLWPFIRATKATMSFLDATILAINNFELNMSILSYMIFSITEGANFLVSYSIVIDFPEIYDFFYGTTIFKIFVIFIPRSLWEDKWKSIAVEAANIYNPDLVGFSLNTTFLGEIFANFGFLGLFIIPFLTLLLLYYLRIFFNKFSNGLNIDFLFFVVAFQIMRANLSDMIINILSLGIFLFLVIAIKSILRKIK
jgi:oligosaccharide repeat unit polymerase